MAEGSSHTLEAEQEVSLSPWSHRGLAYSGTDVSSSADLKPSLGLETQLELAVDVFVLTQQFALSPDLGQLFQQAE